MSRRQQSASRKTFLADFRLFFFRGLAILLPTILTLWLLVQAYMFVDAQVAEPINRGIRAGVIQVLPRVMDEEDLPEWFKVPGPRIDAGVARMRLEGREVGDTPEQLARTRTAIRDQLRTEQFREKWDEHWYLRLIGLFVAITLIYFAGMLLSGFIGRRIFGRIERFLTSIPGFKQVYPHVKQVVDLILGDKPMAFRQVVLVQYPRQGIWTVGLVTSSSMRLVRSLAQDDDVVSIFIPSTPTPFTGFTINVPKRDVVELPISIDEAIRFFITGGVLVPEGQANEPMSEFQKKAAAAMSRADTGETPAPAPGQGVGSPPTPPES